MSPALYATVWIALGFLLGSIPFGYIVARARGLDIRKVGSGNIGMTNVWRELGAGAGITVLVLDALKGWLPVTMLYWCLQRLPVQSADLAAGLSTALWLPMLVALAAVLGHTFSPWMKFKGGKGVATGLGVLIALYQIWVLIPLAIFLLTLALSRYVSLGSILAALAVAALPLLALAGLPQLQPLSHLWPFGVLVAIIVVYTHRENIRRLMAGTERKVGSSKPAAEPG